VPELPEVETIRRIVQEHLLGLRCTAVEVRLPKLLRFSQIPDLAVLVGQKVVGSGRRAKVLTIEFSSDLTLMIHFKLAGQLAVHRQDGRRAVAGHPIPRPDGPYPHRATHVDFHFSDGTVAYYSDVRQFGWLRLMPTSLVADEIERFEFGPEATAGGFDSAYLRDRLLRRRIPIKLALLDQRVLAGLGNIYVDEALFAARIDPHRVASDLEAGEIAMLCETIPFALEEGIKQGGATIINHRAFPVDGFPAVHGRAGEPCNRCGNTIEKTRVGARGTYFCRTCQTSSVDI
jgi:formamidopyrimidine-DNA glycosylase